MTEVMKTEKNMKTFVDNLAIYAGWEAASV